jgi:serine/threonine-protein kinase RsbW
MSAPDFISVPGEKRIRLSIESRLDAVPLAGLAIRGILKDTVPDTVLLYQIEVAVVEAVNNVIQHAYDGNDGHDVDIALSIHSGIVVITICDTGKAGQSFDRAVIQYDPENIAQLPEGGMGIPLMNSIMDEVEYCRRDGKNCLTMRKKI